MKNRILVVALVVLSSETVVAESGTGTVDMDALEQTMILLQNPQQRQESINKMGDGAKRADETVDAVSRGNSESKEEIYGLASVIFQRIAAEAGGDPEKMQTMLKEALANPKKFAESLTPEEKQRLIGIAGKIKGGQPAAPKH